MYATVSPGNSEANEVMVETLQRGGREGGAMTTNLKVTETDKHRANEHDGAVTLEDTDVLFQKHKKTVVLTQTLQLMQQKKQ